MRFGRFVEILSYAGYNVTEVNYEWFVGRFANNHGPYYSVMRLEAIRRNGVSFNDILNEVTNRDWDVELIHDLEDFENRKSKVVYSEGIQREADNQTEGLSFGYNERVTLSYLNCLGDVDEDYYESIYNDRDMSKWRGAYKVQRIKCIFGSFEKAKELSRVYNHKVVKVEWVEEKMDAYDIEVPGLSNFLIDLGDNSGVFVHN